MAKTREDYVFGLDIGTRSIVGTVGYRKGTDHFVVVAQVSKEHKTRAVIDGQVHDIITVSDMIKEVKSELEEEIGQELTNVSIAAAGRVLKTKNVYVEYEMPKESKVTKAHIKALDSMAIEKAYEEIKGDADHKDKHFYCVGSSAVKYYLNGYPMEMIEEHTAASIGVDMIATFLPDEVVDGLYSAVERADLNVISMTLEPIAAINISIPERFRLLNIALVDVGAGTSDISVVKDGSIIAFGMIPLAGDEITEAIAKNYLIDFERAEKVKKQASKKRPISFKNIMGESFKLTGDEVRESTKEAINYITGQIGDKIIELNGNIAVSAVFVVGGGAKIQGFTEALADKLQIPASRVSIRGSEVLQQIDFSGTGIKKDSTLVTPIGICMEYYEQKSNFINVKVNDEKVKLYDNGNVTILDACIHAGFTQNSLFPSRGRELIYYVNGEERVAKGRVGEPAFVMLNGSEVNLNEKISSDDVIVVKPATVGENASIMVGRIPECKEELKIIFMGRTVLLPVKVRLNGKRMDYSYEIRQGDKLTTDIKYKISEVFEFMDVDVEDRVLLNDNEVSADALVNRGDEIEKIKPKPKAKKKKKLFEFDAFKQTPDTMPGQDPLLTPVKPLPDWADDLPIENPVAHGRMPAYQMPQGMPQVPPFNMSGTGFNQSAAGGGFAISVEVNGKKVNLGKKEEHTFVELFDEKLIDVSKAGGSRLITKINGIEITDFSIPIKSGDHIEWYWK